MKQALIIRHSEVESLARNYTAVLEAHGFHLEALNLFESAPGYDRFQAPDLDDVSLVLVLGGPLSANNDYEALRRERAYLGEAPRASQAHIRRVPGRPAHGGGPGRDGRTDGRAPVRAAQDLRHPRGER